MVVLVLASWSFLERGKHPFYDDALADAAGYRSLTIRLAQSVIHGVIRPRIIGVCTATCVSDIFTSVSKDTDFWTKPRQHQTSTYGSAGFRDHWYS